MPKEKWQCVLLVCSKKSKDIIADAGQLRDDLARQKDEARFQLAQYPGLLEGVLDSLTAAMVHKRR